MRRRRPQQRRPARVGDGLARLEVDPRALDRGDGAPGVVVVLVVPPGDARVGEGVVELRVEAGGLDDFGLEG